jgi:hypothetical protein
MLKQTNRSLNLSPENKSRLGKENIKCPRSRAWLGGCPDPCWAFLLIGGQGIGWKGLRDQVSSQYTHPFFLSPYPCSLSPQIISLDISQRSDFVLPVNFSPNFFQFGGHFLFSWYFVPTGSSNPENPCAARDWRLWWG